MSKIQKIAIVGAPGSGKSTLATYLGNLKGFSVYHLDNYVFDTSGKKREKSEIISLQQSFIDQDSWIIDGCSMSTLDMRFSRADAVVYLKFSRFTCLWHILKRCFVFNGSLANTGCLQLPNWTLLKYIWHFHKNNHKKIVQAMDRFPHLKCHILENTKQVQDFINHKPF